MNDSASEKRHTISFVGDPEYWKALGRFIEKFADIEAVMFSLLIRYAGIKYRIGQAVFSGVRTDVAMDFVRRIIAVEDPGDEKRDDLTYVFAQLKAISDARNGAVHYASFMTNDKGRVVSNLSRAHLLENVKETPISADVLDAMTADLDKISAHLALHYALPKGQFAGRVSMVPVLTAAWRYTPPPQQQSRKKPSTRPQRARR